MTNGSSVGSRAWAASLLLALLGGGLVGCQPAADGDRLAQVLARGELVWGADEEGGGPFVFPDPENPQRRIGFEVELAELLARELSTEYHTPIRPRFYQGQWDALPSLLNTGEIDLVLNGYELTPERARDYYCSRPYYKYGLQLMARPESDVKSWQTFDDAQTADKGTSLTVGVLGASAAESYLAENYPQAVEPRIYDGNTQAMIHTEQGLLDATLQDDCIAQFYKPRFPGLKLLDEPRGGGYYVTLVKQGEDRLGAALDRALQRLMTEPDPATGKTALEDLYDRWNLGGRRQMEQLRETGSINAAQKPTWQRILTEYLPLLAQGAAVTVLLSVLSFPLAIVIGIVVAVGRLYGPRPLAWVLGAYVELVRGTPLLLQLYVIFYLLPELGIQLPALAAAVSGLAINYSAYEAEIYRAGLQAVPRGQMEAALSLGMTPGQAIRRILLPQAVRMVIPPVTNDFIALFKDTSVCSIITMMELTKRYSILAQSTGAIVELAALTAVLYLLMSYPLALFARWSEKRLTPES